MMMAVVSLRFSFQAATRGGAPSSAASRHASQQLIARSVIIGNPQCKHRIALGFGVAFGFTRLRCV
jgi:hypothetical protein